MATAIEVIYKIIAITAQGREEVDEALIEEQAEFLRKEYLMAYGKGARIKIVAQPV